MADKIGVYFDEASLGQALDIQKLVEGVQRKWGDLCPVVKIHPHLSSAEGRAMIQADIDAGAINAVCACGSSPRVEWEFYQFGPDILVDRVNLRELCTLCYNDPCGEPVVAGQTPELLQKMATDYVNMGIIKLQKANVPDGDMVEAVKHVLVIGGGWSGLSAALDVSKAGYPVTLVEKRMSWVGLRLACIKLSRCAIPLIRPSPLVWRKRSLRYRQLRILKFYLTPKFSALRVLLARMM